MIAHVADSAMLVEYDAGTEWITVNPDAPLDSGLACVPWAVGHAVTIREQDNDTSPITITGEVTEVDEPGCRFKFDGDMSPFDADLHYSVEPARAADASDEQRARLCYIADEATGFVDGDLVGRCVG